MIRKAVLKRITLLLAVSVMLAACDIGEQPPQDGPRPSPLMYEIADKNGTVEGWMFGTIHALPDNTQWRSDALENANADADLLFVEIADLNDSEAISRIYTQLAARPDLPPLNKRIGSDKRAKLDMLIARSKFTPRDFQSVETWAAALMLAQLARTGKAENGVDRAFVEDFEGRPISEFEGARAQLAIFDSLPEQDQRDLLSGVMDDIDKAETDPGSLRRAWIAGDEAALVEATQTGIMADPELREALLVQRNRDWAEQLKPILAAKDQPMIAVGAGHLVGPDGLPAMLRKQGFTVRRVQ
ncbi:MAG: TraB/GumN family protein [Erythrobacter sp.]